MTAIIEKKLCVVCRINPIIPNSDRNTCYDLMCQIRYNEAHNTFTPKRCTKCGIRITCYNPTCGKCRGN